MSLTSFLFFSVLLSSSDAQAEIEDPLQRGLVVGGVTALSTVVGTVAGVNIGGRLFVRPLDGAFWGAAWGTAIMAPIGAMLVSKPVGADQWIVTGSTAATSVFGLTLIMTANSRLDTSMAGLATLFLMPTFSSGIAAGLAPQTNQIAVSPVITTQYRGLAFHTTF